MVGACHRGVGLMRSCVRRARHGLQLTLTKSDNEPTSVTPMGNSADSPNPLLRPLPAMSHDAAILDAYNPYLGYDAENFPYQQTEREMRVIYAAWSLGRFCGHSSLDSRVRAHPA